MYHGCTYEAQRVLAQAERIALLHYAHTSVGLDTFEELWQHLGRLCAAHYLHGGILLHGPCHQRCVVGFHVMHHQIIGLAVGERLCEMALPLLCQTCVGSVQDSHLAVCDEPTVIAHAFRHNVLVLKEVDIQVIHTDVPDVWRNVHFHLFSY